MSVDPSILLRHRVDAVFGQRRVKLRLQVQVSTTALVCNMVAANVGVSIVHPLVALVFKSLVAILKFEPAIALDYAILSRPGTPSRVSAAFQQAAVAEKAKLTRSLDRDLRRSGKDRSRD